MKPFIASHQRNERSKFIRPAKKETVLEIMIYVKHNRKNDYQSEVNQIINLFSDLTLITSEPEMKRLKMIGNVEQLNKAFGTVLHHFKDEFDRDYISHMGHFRLPDSIYEMIKSVSGLNTRDITPPNIRILND